MADVRIEYTCDIRRWPVKPWAQAAARQAHRAGVVFTDAASAPDTVTENKTKPDVVKSVTQRDY